ncbi:MAG TPA: phosphonate C-P lyase system protein PhnH [Candidatus Binatia bacterium]|nr:phosphonate C-P lyase system protein PhnH [Candidatus Binatia bacterium]
MPDAIAVSHPGLTDPVGQSQEIFRTVLTALAEPGRVLDLASAPDVPLGIDAAALAILLTLADGDTPVWIGGTTDGALAAYLRFHTGAPIVSQARAAQFAVVVDPSRYLPLSDFDPGVEDFPDRAATVIIGATALAESGDVALRGPGIPDRRRVTIGGLPARFAADWAENHAEFPCGVDVLFTCGRRILGLPRSIILEAPCT